MIINVRGTHGAGKTTLVRNVMKQFTRCKPVRVEGRQHPIAYICDKRVVVLGHYENEASGGCDTIPDVATTYGLIEQYAPKYHVLFEGILAQHSGTRFRALAAEHNIRVVQIDIDICRAIRSVRQRRSVRGAERKPLDPSNLVREWLNLQTSAKKLADDGFRVYRYTKRADALNRTLTLLGCNDD